MTASHVIDAYMERQQERKRRLIKQGMTAEEADDKATDEIRREIRNGPPIKIA